MNQKKQASYRPQKRRGTTLIPLVTLTVLVAIVSAGIAGVWQLLDTQPYVTPQMVQQKTMPRTGTGELPHSQSSEAPPAASGSGTGAQPEGSSQPQGEAPSPMAADITEYEVPRGEWVGSEYFSDALFVGDSITEGIKIYDIMSNATVLSYTGINIDNIFTKQVVKSGDGKITIIEAARLQSPANIYVMMGANSMGYDKETFIKGYGRLVDTLHEMHPNAVLYVQSILPVTEEYATRRPEFSNEKIDEYNLALRQMARDKGMPYVNVAAAFKNEKGALSAEASPKDGMHFSASWYAKWFDYLREHVQPVQPLP